MGEAHTLAHATFRGIDSVRLANPFAKLDAAMPHALVPSLDDRASSITVMRRSREVVYRRSHVGFMDGPSGDLPLVSTFAYFLTSPPLIGRPTRNTSRRFSRRPPATTTGRAHRPPRSPSSSGEPKLRHRDALALEPVDSRVVLRGGGSIRQHGRTPVGGRGHDGQPTRPAAYSVGHPPYRVGPPRGAAEQGEDETRRERGDHPTAL